MKRIIVVLAILALPLHAYAAFYSGNDLNLWMAANDRGTEHRSSGGDFYDAAELVGYVTAVSDSFDGFAYCIPTNASASQLMAVVKKYLRERPEQWNMPASKLVIGALSSAFPCAKK